MKLFAEMDTSDIHTVNYHCNILDQVNELVYLIFFFQDVVMHTEEQLSSASKNQEDILLPESMKDLTEAIEEVDLFLSTISLMIFLDRSYHNAVNYC
jgi:hypothetical protein